MYQNFARFFDRKPARQARPHRAQKKTAAGAFCRLRPRSFFFSAFFFMLCLGQFLGCGNGCGGHLNGAGLQQRRRTGGRCGPCRDNVIDQQHPLAGQVGAGAAGKGCFRAAQPFLAVQLLLRAARILYVERRHHRYFQHCAQPARQQKRQPRYAGPRLVGRHRHNTAVQRQRMQPAVLRQLPHPAGGQRAKDQHRHPVGQLLRIPRAAAALAAQNRAAHCIGVVVGGCRLPQRVKSMLSFRQARRQMLQPHLLRQAGQADCPLHGIRPEQRPAKRAPARKQQRQQPCARHLRAPLNRSHSRAYRSVLHGTAPDRHP